MTTQTAILSGFLMIAVAIIMGPPVRQLLITPASAQSMDVEFYKMFSRGLEEIANAISGIEACSN